MSEPARRPCPTRSPRRFLSKSPLSSRTLVCSQRRIRQPCCRAGARVTSPRPAPDLGSRLQMLVQKAGRQFSVAGAARWDFSRWRDRHFLTRFLALRSSFRSYRLSFANCSLHLVTAFRLQLGAAPCKTLDGLFPRFFANKCLARKSTNTLTLGD